MDRDSRVLNADSAREDRDSPTLNRDPTTFNRDPPTLNSDQAGEDRYPPTLNRYPPTLNRDPRTLNRDPPTLNRYKAGKGRDPRTLNRVKPGRVAIQNFESRSSAGGSLPINSGVIPTDGRNPLHGSTKSLVRAERRGWAVERNCGARPPTRHVQRERGLLEPCGGFLPSVGMTPVVLRAASPPGRARAFVPVRYA